ncbi:MAG: hypothetical protein ACKPKO_44820, partial [Candidatus Fonsibacter sp.]
MREIARHLGPIAVLSTQAGDLLTDNAFNELGIHCALADPGGLDDVSMHCSASTSDDGEPLL